MRKTTKGALLSVIALAWTGLATPSQAACKKIAPDNDISISQNSLTKLKRVGIDRSFLFEALQDVSVPETNGCWSGATGNFDSQLISLGVLQWNFGQNSLQPRLAAYRLKLGRSFKEELERVMPKYGKLIFSEGCLRTPVTTECRDRLLELQNNNKLDADLAAELNALFETPQMVQIQVDRFVALVESIEDDLLRLFPNERPTARRIKWAIDTKVQQGGFPGDKDVARMRDNWKKASLEERARKLTRLVQWYEALSNSIDQDGIRLDWVWNTERWRARINQGLTDEQMDLLNLTFLRSRTAIGESGRWQALTFQRRAKIIMGVGSVAGHRLGS